jgi:hypothetical protein
MEGNVVVEAGFYEIRQRRRWMTFLVVGELIMSGSASGVLVCSASLGALGLPSGA